MQKFEGTLITDNGLNLLTTVNGGDDKIQYTKAVLAADDFTQASSTAIQKITGLTIKMSSPISINSRINDTINLSASFTNETITEDFDFYCIGWYAKGVKDSTEYLIAVSPSTVKQTMPAGSNNAATAAISPKYAMTLSRSAEVVVNTNPAGSVTKEYVDNQVNALIAEGIINNGSIVSTTDDCNKMITTSYHLVKGSLPLNAPDGFSTNGQIIVYGNKDTTDGVTQLAYDDINGVSYVRSYNPTNNQWSTWDLIITKSQLNAVLPTDIARTGENNDFKGKNTFETDPVDGAGNAYAKTVDVNQQLDKKVVDNKDGTEQLNGVQVQPYNKLTDTIGGRNYLINTNSPGLNEQSVRIAGTSYYQIYNGNPSFQGQYITLTSASSDETFWRIINPQPTVNPLPAGTYTLSGYLSSSDNMWVAARSQISTDGNHWQDMNHPRWQLSSTEQKFSYTFTIPSNATGWYTSFEMFANDKDDRDNTGKSFTFRKAKLELGDIATDWTPAPEDKVSVSDMRKPANDVAGIDEVNAKQDKIGYTPADDSKVVHTADMRKPANDVAGIEEVNTKQDKIGYTPADDSKVAHLSGANNFDTVPTVNNNPLLLASSLPSTLADTTKLSNFTAGLQSNGTAVATSTDLSTGLATKADDSKVVHNTGTEEVAGQKTFDVAPIDKATGNPYITKDGVPSDVARTSQQTNFTAGLQSGGVSVATSDDLKSVEESAWRELDLSGTSGIYQGKILIKIDQANKYIYFIMNAQVPLNVYTKGTKIIDLSNVVTSLTGAHGYLQGWIDNLENPYNIAGSTMIVGGSSIELGDTYNSNSTGVTRIATEADGGKQYCYVTYDSLVNN